MRYFYDTLRIGLGFIGLLLLGLGLGLGIDNGVGVQAGGASSAGSPVPPFIPTDTPTPSPTFVPHGCTTFQGSITNNDATQAGGLNPNGPTSVCHYWPGCPGVTDSAPRHYDVYHFVNLTSVYNCITIQLDAPTCTGANAVISAVYYSFDPANICAHYEAGTAISPSGSYSFYIPCCGRGVFDVVVAEANPGAGCGSYTVSVLSDITCPTGSTATPTPNITTTPTFTPTPTATPTCVTSVLDWRIVPAPDPAQGTEVLNGVTTLAADDVWAVGTQPASGFTHTLIMHWDGQAWSVVPSPNAGTGNNRLTGVAALAPDDVWAVGSYDRGGGQWGALTEHWNGSAWSVVASPIIGNDTLAGVAGVAANDVWAVGTSNERTLALHWDGLAWTHSTTPNYGVAGNALLSVTALTASDVWAVGRYYDGIWAYADQTLSLHWDGSGWVTNNTPNTPNGANVLNGVGAVAGGSYWAVGTGNRGTLTERWLSGGWVIQPSPNSGNNDNILNGLAVVPTGHIWAVGQGRNFSTPYRTLLEYWDGSSWGVAPSPNSGGADNILYGIALHTATDIWAVGTDSNGALILHYALWACDTPTPGPSHTPTTTRTPPATLTPVISLTPSATGTGQPATLIPTPTGTPCAVAFTDVPVGSTFYPFVRCLACRGIVSGYPCGGPGEPCPGLYYRPNNNVTRGQVSKIMAAAAGLADPVPSSQQTFTDVAPGSTFWLWVEQLAGRGIIGGYACGGVFEPCLPPLDRPYFRPNNAVTRGQLAKITSGAALWAETPTEQTFADVPVGSTFYVYIERVASRGIVGGYPCGGAGEPCVAPDNRPYFRPNNPATRGQLSKIAAQAFFPNCLTPARR